MSQLPFPERVLHQHIAVLGKTGSGKSSALRVIVEHLLARKRRVVVVDPKGDWWGLKSSADGRAAGLPVIMFGDFKEPRATDVPINDRSGKHVAELIASGNRPCVLGFRGWMPAQLVRFWLEFAPALFNANEGELYVVIDEVHNFAPKGKIFDPDAGKCLHWTNRIMSEGRGLGLTFFIASQRPQKVHNDTLDCCETLVAMRVAHPAARQALKDWIDGNGDPAQGKEVLATLAQLKRGEAWIWSPENDFGPVRAQFPMFGTFDSFAPPQLQKKVDQAGWSEIDLDQVKEKLATVIAEAKANDPKELKIEISRLRSELAKKLPAPADPDPAAIEHAIRTAIALSGEAWRMAIADYRKKLDDVLFVEPKAGAFPGKIPPAPAVLPRPKALPAPDLAASNGRLQKGEKEILLAAAQCNPADRTQLTVLSGYKRSTRNRYIQLLQQKGYLEPTGRDGDPITPTAAGMAALGDAYRPLPTGPELQQYWLERLPEGEKRVFEIVLASHGAAVDRDAISETSGYLRSTRNRYIQLLQARHLLKPGAGPVEPAAELFDGSRRKYG